MGVGKSHQCVVAVTTPAQNSFAMDCLVPMKSAGLLRYLKWEIPRMVEADRHSTSPIPQLVPPFGMNENRWCTWEE